MTGYVHGYDEREETRLQDQASTLDDLLHADTRFPAGSRVLEVGCGVGAQTIVLARNSPEALITSIDISAKSLEQAKRTVESAGFGNVRFQQEDIFELSFEARSFDHLFVCFVLEHLRRPSEALAALRKLLRPGGTITVIEGDHGSAYFYPDSVFARKAIQCQIDLQGRSGGNANIGRELFPLLEEAGFSSVRVSPRMVYVDASRAKLVEGFIKNTFTAMIEGIRDAAVDASMIAPAAIDQGIEDLHRTAEPDGVFCYTFFKAFATKE